MAIAIWLAFVVYEPSVTDGLSDAVLLVAVSAIIGALGLSRSVGLQRLLPTSFATVVILCLPLLSVLVQGLLADSRSTWGRTPIPLVVVDAFSEELVFRGLLLALLLPDGKLRAIFATSALFGLMHMTNGIMWSYYREAAITNAIAGSMLGVVFASAQVRGRSLWTIAAAHAVFNVAVEGLGLTIPSLRTESDRWVATIVTDLVVAGGALAFLWKAPRPSPR